MKLKTGSIIKRLNSEPIMTDQETIIVAGQSQLTGGRKMTVGDVLSTILTTKKVEQFNAMKAFVLAQRFYRKDVVDFDDSDYAGIRQMVEQNDQFIPLVIAQVLQVLMEAKDGQNEKRKGV